MKPNGLAAFMADLAVYLLVAWVVALLVSAVPRVARPVGAMEHHLAARIVRAASRS